MIVTYSLTKTHLRLLYILKKRGSLRAASGWSELVESAIAAEDSIYLRAAKKHLFYVLSTFIVRRQGLEASKSPYPNDTQDTNSQAC